MNIQITFVIIVIDKISLCIIEIDVLNDLLIIGGKEVATKSKMGEIQSLFGQYSKRIFLSASMQSIMTLDFLYIYNVLAVG